MNLHEVCNLLRLPFDYFTQTSNQSWILQNAPHIHRSWKHDHGRLDLVGFALDRWNKTIILLWIAWIVHPKLSVTKWK